MKVDKLSAVHHKTNKFRFFVMIQSRDLANYFYHLLPNISSINIFIRFKIG